MHTICRGEIRLFWCFYGVTYNFIQNHNHWRDLHQIFSCLFETFGTMSAIMFSSDSMSFFFVQQLKIHECLLSFTTSLFWNGWETMVQKFENDRNFLLFYHCWFQLISIVIHIQAILDFQNNLYFQETQQTNATITCHIWKKKSSSSKGPFSLWKASFRLRSYDINLGKVNSFIIEQIRIIEFCPLNITRI